MKMGRLVVYCEECHRAYFRFQFRYWFDGTHKAVKLTCKYCNIKKNRQFVHSFTLK